MSAERILFEQRGALGLVTLNRSNALNALTHAMCVAMHAQLARWRDDDSIRSVAVRGAGERAFCAGGDIRALFEAGKTDKSLAIGFYRDEYWLNASIKHFPKPYIALLHGIVMGGGVGVSVHGTHRVADASTVFAMPETGIGMFPDVGGSFFLPRLPGEIGMYLALSGARLNFADIVHTGIATHGVAMAQWRELLDRLAAGDVPDVALSGTQSQVGMAPLSELRPSIDACFSRGSVESVLDALDAHGGAWAQTTAAAIRSKSPLSLEISFRQLREGASLDFDDCMRMEFRLVNRVMAGHDFYEGVRAAIIDKDGIPHWRPETLAEIQASEVDAYFLPLKDELHL